MKWSTIINKANRVSPGKFRLDCGTGAIYELMSDRQSYIFIGNTRSLNMLQFIDDYC